MKQGFAKARFGARVLLAALPLACFLIAPAPLVAQEVVGGPDFSAITTKAAANKLVRKGELVKVRLFPSELGGPDDPDNIVYVTPFAAQARTLLIGTLVRQMKEGLIDRMEVEPDYRGASIIPTKITMTAWHGSKKGSFGAAINIW